MEKDNIELSLDEQVKLEVMLEMGWGFDSPEVKNMTAVRWLILYKVMKERDRAWFETYFKVAGELLKGLLGLELKKGLVIPLSLLLNPELAKKIEELEMYESDILTKPDGQEMSEDEAEKLLEELDSRYARK